MIGSEKFAEGGSRGEAMQDSFSVWNVDELYRLEPPGLGPSVVALGTFDGVHIGHQRILSEARALAAELSCTPIAFTFDRHPLTTLAPERAPLMLTPFEERIKAILACGVAHVAVVRFEATFAALSPQEFLERIVHRALGARGVIAGYNFRFGRGAAGGSQELAVGAQTFRYALRVVPPVEVGGMPVSSTRVRAAIREGAIDEANALLGRPFALWGTVVHGDARGRTLGYPTANVDVVPGALWPGDGVYLSEVRLGQAENLPRRERPLPALAVVSDRPSFATGKRTLECFLLDFSGDLYGHPIEVRFHARLRGIVRFASAEELTSQIQQDVEAARAYFASGGA